MDVNQLPVDGATPSVSTDFLKYLPGRSATITTSGFIVGSTIEFQVFHVLGAGAEGVYGTLDDTISGGNGKDVIYGGSGDDIISGNTFGGANTSENGKDVIYGEGFESNGGALAASLVSDTIYGGKQECSTN
jgi:Ca2+-binding RTX toxin-like protein